MCAERRNNKVLVIGAGQSMARMLRLTLRDEGFEVTMAPELRSTAQRGALEADVIVVDLPIWHRRGLRSGAGPNFSGYAVPVIALTGADPKDVMKETGAAAALQKPFDGDLLARIIDELVADAGQR